MIVEREESDDKSRERRVMTREREGDSREGGK